MTPNHILINPDLLLNKKHKTYLYNSMTSSPREALIKYMSPKRKKVLKESLDRRQA